MHRCEPVPNSIPSLPGEEGLRRLVCHKCMHEHTHTHMHVHAHACPYPSSAYVHTLVGTGTFFSILTQAHTGTLPHFHCHTCLACSLTFSHREPSLSYTHCPLHTPNPCSQVSLDHMSSCGGGAVWPRLLLPPPPPGMRGEDAGTQDWGPGCSFTPEVVVAAHRTIPPYGREPWLLKNLCHPELDSGGGESSREGGTTPWGGSWKCPARGPTACSEMDYYYCPSLLKLLRYLWVSVGAGVCRSSAQSAFLLANSNCGRRSMGGRAG